MAPAKRRAQSRATPNALVFAAALCAHAVPAGAFVDSNERGGGVPNSLHLKDRCDSEENLHILDNSDSKESFHIPDNSDSKESLNIPDNGDSKESLHIQDHNGARESSHIPDHNDVKESSHILDHSDAKESCFKTARKWSSWGVSLLSVSLRTEGDCTEGCHENKCECGWWHRCYKLTKGGKDVGVCEPTPMAMVYMSLTLFFMALAGIMGLRTMAAKSQQQNEIDWLLQEAKAGNQRVVRSTGYQDS